MALREFYPVVKPLFQQASAPLIPARQAGEICSPSSATDQASENQLVVQSASDMGLTASESLARDMDSAKQALLALLQQNPIAGKMLAEQPAIADHESGIDSIPYSEQSASANIVQDCHFVQLETADARQIHYLPTLLLKIAGLILPLSAGDLVYQDQLQQACRQLQTSRQNMIAANTGLVGFVAFKYKTSLSIDDLMQEGIVGLIKAVDRFDPFRGYRFSTYAVYWIRQAISRLIVKQEKVVRLPVALAERASVVFEAMRTCYLEHNRWPSLPELQAHCDLPLEDIKTISGYYQATHSLDAALSEDSDDHNLMAGLKQQQFALPLDALITANLNQHLGKVVASLPEKEATILNMRFGLKNHTEMTLQAIADQLDLTRERVRQIQNAALQKLKQQFGRELLPFLEANEG